MGGIAVFSLVKQMQEKQLVQQSSHRGVKKNKGQRKKDPIVFPWSKRNIDVLRVG